ncbi:spore germination protein KC [Melghirimyces thermohalophilus]|uniref:Spore germination protein KC n=1 Tax=Melghirimyces thermohalophilus TaxID=1236220 RepID=A0A1G6NT48_9BACL|nr:Ger(x)C family spore germination protein [Melghirimyces thermohalophilus]SDC71103.1 spore germination protein KC [Melghirimyces thermohalophilus]
MDNKRRGKALKCLCILLLITPWLTGCWDRTEMEERGIILGLGIDTAPPEAEKHEDQITETNDPAGFPPPGEEMIKVTAQVAVPGRVPLGPGQGGSQGGGGGGSQKPVWAIQVMGHTLEDALQNLQQQVAQQLYLGHLRIVVVSEELAKRGLKENLDLLMRDPEIRKSSYLLVSRGPASKALAVAPPLERVPTLYLSGLMDHAVQTGRFPQSFIGNFFTAYAAKGKEGYLPYVQPKGGNKPDSEIDIEIDGLAYFVGDKMVGHTEPVEVARFMEVIGIGAAGYSVSVPVPGQQGNVMIRKTERAQKPFVEIRRGKPLVHVFIHVEGELDAKSNQQIKINSTQTLQSVRKGLSRRLQRINAQFVQDLQKEGSDIFGFGEQVRAQEPEYWNRHVRTREKWRQVFKNELQVKVTVTSSIRRTGMRER